MEHVLTERLVPIRNIVDRGFVWLAYVDIEAEDNALFTAFTLLQPMANAGRLPWAMFRIDSLRCLLLSNGLISDNGRV